MIGKPPTDYDIARELRLLAWVFFVMLMLVLALNVYAARRDAEREREVYPKIAEEQYTIQGEMK